jgi:hypothetical protein
MLRHDGGGKEKSRDYKALPFTLSVQLASNWIAGLISNCSESMAGVELLHINDGLQN